MPHIIVDGCDMTRNIERIYLHAEVDFSEKYFHTPAANLKMQELMEKLEKVIAEYFNSVESDIYNNYEYNVGK